MDFIHDNWVALLSLVVAAIGGVPGILSVIEHRRRRPILSASIATVMSATIRTTPPTSPRAMVMFSVTLGNDGETPLLPATIECNLKMNGKWYELQPMLIPETANFGGGGQEIEVGDPVAKDLQRQRITITHAAPVTGLLMYSSGEFTQDEFRRADRTIARFQFVDLLGRKHKADAKLNPHDLPGDVTYPRQDITIRFPPTEP